MNAAHVILQGQCQHVPNSTAGKEVQASQKPRCWGALRMNGDLTDKARRFPLPLQNLNCPRIHIASPGTQPQHLVFTLYSSATSIVAVHDILNCYCHSLSSFTCTTRGWIVLVFIAPGSC